MNYHDLDGFTRAYVECALWSTYDESNEPLEENYGFEDIAEKTLKDMVKDCKDFQESNRALLDACEYSSRYNKDEMAGHDFWLTRNGHGAGFWDRGFGELGDKLTKACKTYGDCYLYVGDDGRIYHD